MPAAAKKPKKKKAVRRIPPTTPEARDEGPRLIPLDKKQDDSPAKTSAYYAHLAEKLLRPLK
jgi:hypothetical protein